MKKKLLLATGVALVTLLGNGVINATNRYSISADEKPPIVTQVEEHEARLDEHGNRIEDLESSDVEIRGQVQNNTNETTIVRDRVVTVEKKVEAQQPASPTPAPVPQPEVIDPYKVVNFERIYHTNGQYPLLKCVYQTYNGETWWTAARSAYVKDEPCQFDNPSVLTADMRKRLTNRPIDVF